MPPAPVGPIVEWRPLTAGDIPAWAALYNAARDAEGAPDEQRSLDELHHELEDPAVRPAEDTRAGFDGSGRMLAWGSVWCRPSVTTMGRAVLHGDVHPGIARQGVGTALLTWQEGRARERLGAEVPPGLPRRIDVFTPQGVAGRDALLTRAGYRAIRWFHKMHRSLAEPIPTAPVPAGVEMIAWSDAWLDATLDARDDAWRDHWGFEPMPPAVWRHLLIDDPAFLRPAGRLGVVDGRVVGFVLCSEQAVDERKHGRTAWLDLIAVRRPWRRRGLASALIASSLVALVEEGFRTAVLTVDASSPTGALDLYEHHGFQTLRTETLYALELPPVVPGSA